MIMIITIIIIIIITIMTMIALKGAMRDVNNLLTALQTVSYMHAQAVRAQSCTNHVQHRPGFHLRFPRGLYELVLTWLPCKALASHGQRWDWLARCQYMVTRGVGKLDQQPVSVWQHV